MKRGGKTLGAGGATLAAALIVLRATGSGAIDTCHLLAVVGMPGVRGTGAYVGGMRGRVHRCRGHRR